MKITPSELQRRLQTGGQIQLIDVRSQAEYSRGHVPGAANIPLETLQTRAKELDAQVETIVICLSGHRASVACGLLKDLIPKAKILEGGTAAWAAAQLPIERKPRETWSIERQIRLMVGVFVILSLTLGLTVSTSWFALAGLMGAGLVMAGITDFCPMALVIAALPWNKPRTCAPAQELRTR